MGFLKSGGRAAVFGRVQKIIISGRAAAPARIYKRCPIKKSNRMTPRLPYSEVEMHKFGVEGAGGDITTRLCFVGGGVRSRRELRSGEGERRRRHSRDAISHGGPPLVRAPASTNLLHHRKHEFRPRAREAHVHRRRRERLRPPSQFDRAARLRQPAAEFGGRAHSQVRHRIVGDIGCPDECSHPGVGASIVSGAAWRHSLALGASCRCYCGARGQW